MADKVTREKTLKLQMNFYDGDDRVLALDNPKDNLTAAQVKSVATVLKNNQAILGDKSSAAFVGFKSAKVLEKETVQFDLVH